MLAWGDKVVMYDDFLGDAVRTDLYLATAIGAGSPTMAFPATQLANGVIRTTTGTTDNSGAILAGDLSWLGDLNVVMQTRVKSNAVTSLKIEIGLSNLAGRDTEIVNVYDTPSFQTNQTDVLCAEVDTDGTTGDRWKLQTDGTTTDMNATGTISGEAIGAAATALTTAVVDVYDVITLTGIGNRARMYRNGKSLAHHGGALASQFEGGTLLYPSLGAYTKITTGRLVDWDYLIVAQDRV